MIARFVIEALKLKLNSLSKHDTKFKLKIK